MMKTFGTTEIAYPLIDVAKAAHERFIALRQEESQLKEASTPAEIQRLWNVSQKALSESVITVVFTAIYLESFIYKYACNYMPLHYYDENLDSLSAISKWVVIPKLVDGKHINIESKGFKMYRDLIRCRNRIVHPKMFSIDVNMKNTRKVQSHNKELDMCAGNAMETICELMDTLVECVGKKIDGVNRLKDFCRK